MAHKNYFTYDELLKRQQPKAFSTMLKPVGSRCNLDCAYCYYLDKEDIYAHQTPRMSDELLEEYTKQYIEGNRVDCVSFIWHGGEPMLAGLDFYRRAIDLQRRYANGKRIENVLQTNATLLNAEWCEFLHDNHFLVGVSIDGPQAIHDGNRRDKGGRPTFDKVMAGIELLKQYQVEFNTMTTVNLLSEDHGREIYRFLKGIGSRYMQFMPVVEYVTHPEGTQRPHIVAPPTLNSLPAEWSVTAAGFGRFMCAIFDDWILSDVGSYFVQLFDVSLAQWCGVKPALCSFCDTCGDSLVVEHNGDIYSCDHFVYPEYKLGNLTEFSLVEAFASPRQGDFGAAKHNLLPDCCRHCRWWFACRGECPKHRFDTSPSGEQHLNTLCEGYTLFFAHIDAPMRYMAELLRTGKPAALVMPWVRARMGLR
ncbi:MAG: anaerobic sulfatase maturase [Alistipes sp.]